jgi:hypothetical protein
MAIFSKTTAPDKIPSNFASRAEAFAYMYAWLLDKNNDPLLAAQKANEFADIYANNMALPNNVEPKAEGIDKYIQMADKISDYCDKHPKVTELLLGAVSFVGGLLVARTNQPQSTPPPPPQHEPIDFENVK